ncbi:MAG: hypothetical protein RLZZ262_2547 [Bacteroidota bacterium]
MDNKTIINWSFRGLISGLFLLSAILKLIPLWAFEKQIVDLGLTDWCHAHYLARLIIALEFAIGVGILQKHFLKRLVIPVTVLLLAAFCIHLTIVGVESGFTNGNCGCFGQLLPMTPLEAIIKNVLTIAMAIYLFMKLENDDRSTNRIIVPFAIYGFSAFAMFFFYPFCPCLGESDKPVIQDVNGISEIVDTLQVDTSDIVTPVMPVNGATDTSQTTIVNAIPEPAPVASKFAGFNVFGNKKVNLDKGKKIVCCFAPGCDHCQETAKVLAELAKKEGLPPIYILFMDEEAERIPEFISNSGIKANHTVLDIVKFWTVMKNDGTPAVYYLWNGNVQYQCEGIDANAFNKENFLKAIKGN